MDDEWYVGAEPGRWHLMKERTTITIIFILFVVIFCMVALRLYIRWYFLSQLEHRGIFGNVIFYGEDNQPGPTVDRGLEPEVLNSLPVLSYSVFKTAEQSTQECTVCLSEFEGNDAVRLLPKCNHSFHADCIDMWFKAHSTCPICRSKVEPVANVVKPGNSTCGEIVVELNGSETAGSSSGIRPGNETNTTSLEERRKAVDGLMGPSTEMSSPPVHIKLECELAQSSPSRLTSLKRLLSMSNKRPIDGSGTMSPGSRHGPTELDLECGPSGSRDIRRRGE